MNRLAALEILCASSTAEPSSRRQGCVTGGRLHPRFPAWQRPADDGDADRRRTGRDRSAATLATPHIGWGKNSIGRSVAMGRLRSPYRSMKARDLPG
jgi:hypothetical protein